jgi:hypothetical protein
MNSIYSFNIGESHKLTEKPCQDYAYADSSVNLSMAIVSDGHGGERYFRSNIGSKFIVEITKKSVRLFVETIIKEKQIVFQGEQFTQYIKESATDSQINSVSHKMLSWLFSSIISQWNIAVAKHAHEIDLTDWELSHVDKKYIDEFVNMRNNPDATFEKTYGCTLMAYVQTPTFWFAFHIGDGKLVRMSIVNNKIEFDQPVPWDSRCFLNKTTSICDYNALDEFRYCYQGDGSFPIAVFLGSDGLDDSYGDGNQLYNFYANLYKQIAKSGRKEAQNVLKRALPKISKIASKDDMSVACVYDELNINENFYSVTAYQREMLAAERSLLLDENQKLEEKIKSFGLEETLNNKEKIDLQYAKNDCDKVDKKLKRVKTKLKELENEENAFYKKNHPQNQSTKTRMKNSRTLAELKKIKR